MEEFSLAVKIRLARHGSHKRPYYRVVVADARSPRDGRFIEEVGRYNPLTNPKTINLDLEKIADWQSKGAQLTDAVAALVRAAEAGPKTETVVKKSKKAKSGQVEVDLIPLIAKFTVEGRRDTIALDLIIRAQNPGLNPELIVSAIREHCPEASPGYVAFHRKDVLDAQFQPWE